MPKRTAKFVSAVFVNILAGIPLATMGHGETATADNCLSEPKAETPPGSHWRYRIDHANKRNCWYLRAEGGGLSQAAPQNTPQVPSPPSPAKPSVTDAHAELRARTSREDSPAVGPPANTPAASPAWPAIPSPATATAAVATRWPEPAATNSASSGGSGTANPSGNPPAAADLPKASAASAIADSSPPAQPVRIPALIAAAVGALAFAGAAAKLISRRSRARRPRHRKMVHGRAPIWETTDDDRIFLSDHPPSGNRDYRPRFARSAGSAKVQSTRVQGDRKTEFVPRTPRRAPR